MDWSYYFSIFCAAHLDLIALILLLVSRKNRSNIYLAVFLILFSFVHWQNVLLLGGHLKSFPYFDPICGIVLCLCGPFFLFYIRSITGAKIISFPSDIFHLLPLLIAVAHFIRTLTWTQQEFETFYYTSQLDYTNENKFLLFLMLGYFLCYLFWGLKIVQKYHADLPNYASNLDKTKLEWLRITLYLLIFMAAILAPVLVIIGKIPLMIAAMVYFSTALYLWIVYKSLNHSTVFVNEISQLEKFVEANPIHKGTTSAVINAEKAKYENSALNTDKIEEYYEQLKSYFENKKPFLDPDLSLKSLSVQTNIPAHYISRIINQHYEKNFFDLINTFRIEEFKRKLLDTNNRRFSIEGLAFDSGFGSKASFQRAFIKIMNITPSQYRQSIESQTEREKNLA